MMKQGRNARRYFNHTKDDNGHDCYTFKSREQYSTEQHKDEKQSKRYFATTQLDTLIMDYPRPKKEMTDAAIDLGKEPR